MLSLTLHLGSSLQAVLTPVVPSTSVFTHLHQCILRRPPPPTPHHATPAAGGPRRYTERAPSGAVSLAVSWASTPGAAAKRLPIFERLIPEGTAPGSSAASSARTSASVEGAAAGALAAVES